MYGVYLSLSSVSINLYKVGRTTRSCSRHGFPLRSGGDIVVIITIGLRDIHVPEILQNIIEMWFRLDVVDFLHPRVIKMRRRWRRATLFVDFSNRDFECHMFPLLLPSAARFLYRPY
jgi:hypothetical protein